MPSKPAVSVRRVLAEPADESPAAIDAIDEIAWLAMWEDGTVHRYRNARALLRAVERRDRRDADRAEQLGAATLVATVITWNDIPAGFVPPTSGKVRAARSG